MTQLFCALPRLRWLPYGRPRVAAAPIFSLIAIYLRVFFFASEYLSLMSPWKACFVCSVFLGVSTSECCFWLGRGCYWVVKVFSARWDLLTRSGLFREVSFRQDALRLSIYWIMSHPRAVCYEASRGTSRAWTMTNEKPFATGQSPFHISTTALARAPSGVRKYSAGFVG